MSRRSHKPSTPSRNARSERARATSNSPGRGFTTSSGNVFADLGFPPGEAAHLELRSRLMDWLDKFITDKALTQRQAAQFFGVTQPRISNLVCGRLDLFSLDMLVEMLSRAGVRVELNLRRMS